MNFHFWKVPLILSISLKQTLAMSLAAGAETISYFSVRVKLVKLSWYNSLCVDVKNDDDLVRTKKQMSKSTQWDYAKAKSKACDIVQSI